VNVMKSRILTIAAALLLGFATLAYAGNTVLFSSKSGDVVFPFTPPSSSGSPGTIDNMTIGGTTPAAGSFTTLTSTSAPSGAGITGLFASPPALGGTAPAAVTTNALHVDTGTKTATASAGAATLNKMAGVITSESLSTAAGADYTLTLTNSDIAAADQVMASVQYGTSTAGTPAVATVATAAGSATIIVQNIHATAALNGTIKISFVVFKN